MHLHYKKRSYVVYVPSQPESYDILLTIINYHNYKQSLSTNRNSQNTYYLFDPPTEPQTVLTHKFRLVRREINRNLRNVRVRYRLTRKSLTPEKCKIVIFVIPLRTVKEFGDSKMTSGLYFLSGRVYKIVYLLTTFYKENKGPGQLKYCEFVDTGSLSCVS